MKKVLISGAAGFLGSHLCDRFLAEGHTVIAMDNLITGTTDNDNCAQDGVTVVRILEAATKSMVQRGLGVEITSFTAGK